MSSPKLKFASLDVQNLLARIKGVKEDICECDEIKTQEKTDEELQAEKELLEQFREDMKKNVFQLCKEFGVAYEKRPLKLIVPPKQRPKKFREESAKAKQRRIHLGYQPKRIINIPSYGTFFSDASDTSLVDDNVDNEDNKKYNSYVEVKDWSQFQMGMRKEYPYTAPTTNRTVFRKFKLKTRGDEKKFEEIGGYGDFGEEDMDEYEIEGETSRWEGSGVDDRGSGDGLFSDRGVPSAFVDDRKSARRDDRNVWDERGVLDSKGQWIVKGHLKLKSQRDRDGGIRKSRKIRRYTRGHRHTVGRSIRSTSSRYSSIRDSDVFDDRDSYFRDRDLWRKRRLELEKYYQLKRLAKKLRMRARLSVRRIKGNNDYEEGYAIGFAEGHIEAYDDEPTSDKIDKDIRFYKVSKHRAKTIYIATKKADADELKKIFKHANIQLVKRVGPFSSKTEKIVSQKIHDFVSFYKESANRSDDFRQGYADGFYDAYYQSFIYNPYDITFDHGEKVFVTQVRKSLECRNMDYNLDSEAILDRAENLRNTLAGAVDFEDYEMAIEEEAISAASLDFSETDLIFFDNYEKPDSKSKESEFKGIKSSGALDSFDKNLPLKKYFSMHSSIPVSQMEFDLLNTVSPPYGKRERVHSYMNIHKIEDLFKYLGSKLCAAKPEDPIDFLINVLNKCLLFRLLEIPEKAPLLFTPEHIEAIYNTLDPMGLGYINGTEYLSGLNLLGVADETDEVIANTSTKIEKELFIRHANDRLLDQFKKMIAVYVRDE